MLVVRKEYAATNYFLPGYWPHAALVLGSLDDLQRLGVSRHEHVSPRLRLCEAIVAELAQRDPDSPQPLVLESMKDGVRVRSIGSPLASDSVIVLRPLLEPELVGQALAQAFLHEGKPYDFDFDFNCSHRMVCTEVVYRAYDGVGNVKFELPRHLGRYALAAGDLLRMALAERLSSVSSLMLSVLRSIASVLVSASAALDGNQRCRALRVRTCNVTSGVSRIRPPSSGLTA